MVIRLDLVLAKVCTRSWRRALCLLPLLLSCLSPGELSAQRSLDSLEVLLLSTSMEQRAIEPTEVLYTQDREWELSPATLRNQPLSPMQVRSPLEITDEEYRYWAILRVKNREDYAAEWWLQLPGNYATVTLERQDGSTTNYRGGNLMPLAERSIPFSIRNLSYAPIALAAGEEATLFLRVSASRFYPLFANRIVIGSRLAFENTKFRTEGENRFLDGLYSAILLLFALYCLAYFFYTRETFTVWAILYALSLLVYFLHFTNVWYQFGANPLVSLPLGMVFINLSMLFQLLFLRQYLGMAKEMPRWNKVVWAMILYMGLATLAHAGYYFFTQRYISAVFAVFYIHAVLYVPHIVLAIYLLWKHFTTRNTDNQNPYAIYSVGMLSTYTILIYTNLINGALAPISQKYLQVGVIVYVVAIVISLSLRAGRIRKDSIAAEVVKMRQDIEFQELRSLNELKSRFFTNVSHELRTPLTLMLGPIRRMRRSAEITDGQNSLLEFLERNTVHLRELVNEILDLSKLEEGKMEVMETPTRYSVFLASLLSHYSVENLPQQLSLEIENEVPADYTLQLDRAKFSKIINNYLANAIKFTDDGGRIKVKSTLSGGRLRVEVADTGRGIAAADLPHVFDRFYQSRSEGAKAEGGTGIGLSLCRDLAAILDGEVGVKSTVGRGSTFYVELPARAAELPTLLPATAADERIALPAVPIEKEVEVQAGAKHLLIVEDNADLRAYLKIVLSDYQLTVANHGRQALDYLNDHPAPDLIVSDLMMPVMDGMQLLATLKADDRFRHLPFVMLTAKTSVRVRIQALRYGIDDYLTKPFDDEELQARIENLLAHQQRRAAYLQDEDTETAQPSMAESDLAWLTEVEDYALTNLEEADLSVNGLARSFGLSESTLSRQLKRLTGLTPGKYLRELRLNKARGYLEAGSRQTVAEIAYRVGFTDPAAFSRSFKQRFGCSPSEIGR